ncbi:unnamed protein product, partial [Discosporangium mesarthrocarpum]
MEVEALIWSGRLHRCSGTPGDTFRAEWRCLMCPFEASSTQAQRKWSNRLASVRKDVECYFGRLKGRFRILKLSMLYWTSSNRLREKIDNMFFTCCIVQNMLHARDGLGTKESGVDWMGHDGMPDAYYCDPTVDDSIVGMSGRRLVGSEFEQALEVE